MGLLFRSYKQFVVYNSPEQVERTGKAPELSNTCSGLDAPRMTVLVLEFLATHANAR